MARKDLEQLLTLNRQGRVLSSVAQLLEWDRHTYLPPAGLEARAEQASFIVELYWKKKAATIGRRSRNWWMWRRVSF